MCRMWVCSSWHKVSMFVMTSSSLLSSHLTATGRENPWNPVKTIRQSCPTTTVTSLPFPSCSLLPNPVNRYFILSSACKATLKICTSKSFSLPGVVMGARGVIVSEVWWSGPAAGACFHYLKALVCKELKLSGENIHKKHIHSVANI